MFIKKQNILILFFILAVRLCPGQSADKNYIVQIQLLVPVSNPDSIAGLADGKRIKTIQYFDGLGRISQINKYHDSPCLKDIIQHFEYDSLGRERIHYLPFASDAGGAYKSYGAAQTAAYYLSPPDVTIPRTSYPFAEKVLDDSPLNRLMAYKSPGESWHDHPGQYHYFSNTGSFAAPVFTLNEETLEFSTSGNYPACSLRVDETVDEDGKMESIHYNELGQRVEKNLHGTTGSRFLQSEDYSYNIRGWLTGINTRANGNDSDDVFVERIHYDTAVTGLGGSSLYNGNISSGAWWHHGSSIIRGYSYAYDGANRLTGAAYGQYSGNNWTVNDHYSVPQIEYDRNGNITFLERNGYNGQTFAVIDDLEYDYTGNRLAGVDDQASMYYGFRDNGHYYPDGGDEYGYDANGNMIFDLNKGITGVEYNHLNLPEEITLENNRRITYVYDADGIKLQKKYYEDNRLMETTDYAGGFIYKDHHLDHILTGEGRLKWNDDDKVFYAEFFMKDHLGNVRAVITTDPEHHFLAQGTDYYPFGLEIYIYGYSDYNQLKYNGKELQTEADLTWYDYGARFYDPVIARWHNVDPIAEDYYLHSSYHFAGNNPIKFVDLNGMKYDGWELTLKNDGTKDLKWLNDKGGNETQYVNVKWETSDEKIWDLGTETWNNWPNSELAMADIVSNGEAALGPWNESWWANASGRTELSPIDPVDFMVGAAAAKWAIGGATAAKGVMQTTTKGSGAYLLEFESGYFYAGKGLTPRMNQSILRLETKYGDKLLRSTHFPTATTNEALILEHKLMMQRGGPLSFDKLSPTYNQIFSPGKKLGGF